MMMARPSKDAGRNSADTAGAAEPLTDAEAAAIRREISEAVIGTPEGLRDDLQHNPDAYLRLIAASRTAAEQTSSLLRSSIDSARAAGHSWDTVGRILGVSRQAAQQRFGSPGTPPVASPLYGNSDFEGDAERRVISPLTAFDEMAVLNDEGRRGWHSVDFGTLYHLVERSPWQWEHRRVVWSPISPLRRLESEGWQLVGAMTFPWAYYARQLDLPAERD